MKRISIFILLIIVTAFACACAAETMPFLPAEYDSYKLGECSVMVEGTKIKETSFEVYASDSDEGKTLSYVNNELTVEEGAKVAPRNVTAAQFKRIISDTIGFFKGQVENNWSIYLPNIYLSAFDNVRNNIFVVYSLSRQDYMQVEAWEGLKTPLAPVAFMSLSDPTGLAGGLILICE